MNAPRELFETYQESELDALLEHCCQDRESETRGWLKDGVGSKGKRRPYKDHGELCRWVSESCRMHSSCSIVKTLAPVMRDLSVGSEIQYDIRARKYATLTPEAIQLMEEARPELEIITDPQGDFCDIAPEIVTRYHRDGTVIMRPDDSDRGAYFIDSCLICKPDVDMPEGDNGDPLFDVDQWSYGAVAEAETSQKIIGYWFDGAAGSDLDKQEELLPAGSVLSDKYGYIPVEDLCHALNGVDIGDPLGVPTGGSYEDSLKHSDLIECTYKFLKIQMRTAVWTKDSGNAVQIENMAKQLHAMMGKSSQDSHDPGIFRSKNKELQNMQISSVKEIIEFVNFLETRAANCWGLPGWVATGDISSGNQHNMEQSIKFTIERIRASRKVFTRLLVKIILGMLASRLKWTDVQVELFRRNFKVVPAYPELTFESVKERFEAICKVRDRGIISDKQARTDMGYDHEQQEREIAEQGTEQPEPQRIDLGDGEGDEDDEQATDPGTDTRRTADTDE